MTHGRSVTSGPGQGPQCFDHARVLSFEVTAYSFPNCPQVLDNYIDFDDINKHGIAVRKKNHSFMGSGTDHFHIHLAFEGRFIHHSVRAEGSYKIDEGGCTTGRRTWSIPLHHARRATDGHA